MIHSKENNDVPCSDYKIQVYLLLLQNQNMEQVYQHHSQEQCYKPTAKLTRIDSFCAMCGNEEMYWSSVDHC